MAKLEALARRRRAVLRLSVHESASKVNRSGGDAQVVFCHRYVVFHPFVAQYREFLHSIVKNISSEPAILLFAHKYTVTMHERC